MLSVYIWIVFKLCDVVELLSNKKGSIQVAILNLFYVH